MEGSPHFDVKKFRMMEKGWRRPTTQQPWKGDRVAPTSSPIHSTIVNLASLSPWIMWPFDQLPPTKLTSQGKIIFQPSKFSGAMLVFGGILGVSKWLGSPPFISHETDIWKENKCQLGGQQRSPWLFTTHKSWDDPPSIQQSAKRPNSQHLLDTLKVLTLKLRQLRWETYDLAVSTNMAGIIKKWKLQGKFTTFNPLKKTYAHQIFGSFLQIDRGFKKRPKKNLNETTYTLKQAPAFCHLFGNPKSINVWDLPRRFHLILMLGQCWG